MINNKKSAPRQVKKKKSPAKKAVRPFRKVQGETWAQTRNRGARELGYADYTDYRLTMARRAGKTIQQARGHGGANDKREKTSKTFRPGKRSKSIYAVKRRTATTTQTPAYVYDLLPYPLAMRLAQIPRIIAGAKRVEKKHGRVMYRFMRYGVRYEENTEPDYWFDDTWALNDRASWLSFRADMTTGIQGIVGDPIVAVWLYAGRREVYE